ncbi:MAG TPA: LptA/OstA family protein [Kiritimatiellia bacterium]|jgi:lipopolysaccharide transport protein LptA|nr:LptA/OstA family protein [Kiritimatiellia bacterium]
MKLKRFTGMSVAAAGLLAVAGVFAQAAADSGGAAKKADAAKTTGAKAAKAEAQTAPEREAVITAERIEFDNKEGVILFDENVVVDDAQFVMRSDRLLVFMEGTNDVQQIMAVGRVSITNLNRSASCDKAVYTRKDGQIVMTGNARLMRQGDEGGEVTGNRITFWLDDERMEVSPGRVVLPPGTFNKADTKKLIPQGM